MQLPGPATDANVDMFEAVGFPFAIKEGLMAVEAVDILKDFYIQTNPNAPIPKPKIGRERK